MLNKVFLMGRLGRDPETRYTNSGTKVATFSLAVDRDFKDKATGERITDWVDVVAWRQTAEFASKWFRKGQMAVVEGRLQVRGYTDLEGNKRRAVEVVADSIYFCGGKDQIARPSEGNADEGSLPPDQSGEFTELDEDDGKLPF